MKFNGVEKALIGMTVLAVAVMATAGPKLSGPERGRRAKYEAKATTAYTEGHTAYGWGNHASAVSNVAGRVTKIANSTNTYRQAYSWGNHASAVSNVAGRVTKIANSTNTYRQAYSWGNHASAVSNVAGRVTKIANSTNTYRQAYSWGNHASAVSNVAIRVTQLRSQIGYTDPTIVDLAHNTTAVVTNNQAVTITDSLMMLNSSKGPNNGTNTITLGYPWIIGRFAVIYNAGASNKLRIAQSGTWASPTIVVPVKSGLVMFGIATNAWAGW